MGILRLGYLEIRVKERLNFYLTGDGPKLQDEFGKMLKE